MSVLERVSSAADVKALPAAELPTLAADVREAILETASRTGGHLASSLGAVELVIGLLRAFDPEKDRVLWDVGHQTYAWKILTGRKDAFPTLRQLDGITGFQNPSESKADAFISGHAGVALAAAEGFAAARDLRGGDESVVAVVGDASLTNGMNLEALNTCAQLAKKMVVVLNDNEMSISRNVGSFARLLGRMISGVRYNRVKAAAERAGHKLKLTFLRGIYHKLESRLKSLWLGNGFFEQYGLRYIGPVDGHDLKAVEAALQVAKEDKRGVVVHVVTVKGKGYAPAERNPVRWHGVGPFDRATGEPVRKAGAGWSDAFGAALCALARRDARVCAVTAAMKDGTGLTEFANEFPERFFDVGICEGQAVSFAAGLAAAGMRPVVAIYSTFLQRAVDQVQHDVCLQHLPVVFAVDRAGCVGEDGATHHGLYDMPMLRALPGMTICAPTCGKDLEDALAEALEKGGPWAIRWPRGRVPEATETSPRHAAPETTGTPLLHLVAVGNQVGKAERVRALLAAKGVAAAVWPVNRVKPLPALPPHPFATLEDGATAGGFGEAAGADFRFGWPDRVIGHGSVAALERRYGFDAESIADVLAAASRGKESDNG